MDKIKQYIRKNFATILHFVFYWQMRIKWRRKVKFDYSCDVINVSTFEGANKINKNTRFHGTMGYGSYIGMNSMVEANIGRFTSIAPNFETNKGIHPIHEPYVSCSPMFYSTIGQCGKTFAKRMMFAEERSFTQIGNDVWIGQNVFAAGGITIGDGAVVLAGAVITKDVEPYSIVGGVPAKHIKYRYDIETREFLLSVKWWNQPIEWLERHWELLCDMDALKAYYFSHREEFKDYML